MKRKLQETLNTWIVKAAVRLRGWAMLRRLMRKSRQVRLTQEHLLQTLLKLYAKTDFGIACGLPKTCDIYGFRRQFPITDYETLRPWIEKQMQDGKCCISPLPPIRYNLTSGSTGKPKFIPVSSNTYLWSRDAQMLTGYGMLRSRPKMLDGKILGIGAPAVEGLTQCGLPLGSRAGQTSQSLPRLIRAKYAIPASVLGIGDYELKYLLILRIALSEEQITYIQTANTSTLVLLSDLLNSHWEQLLSDLETGGFHRWADLSETVRADVCKLLRADPARAAQLRRLWLHSPATDMPRAKLRHLFPHVQAVGCWTSGSCSIFLNRLRAEFSEQTLIRDIGYITSEVHGTAAIEGNGRAAIPMLEHVFFEFVERSAWERGERETLLLDELEQGEHYYVIVTTADGLVRYQTNDILSVEGYLNSLPRLRFVQKGQGFANLTGEKLSEFQVLCAVAELERRYKISSAFFFMIACEKSLSYHLYYEAEPSCRFRFARRLQSLAACLDEELGRLNIEYSAKRQSRRLRPPEIHLLKPGTSHRFRRHWVEAGRREGQFKIIPISRRQDVSFDFEKAADFIRQPHCHAHRYLSKCGSSQQPWSKLIPSSPSETRRVKTSTSLT